MARAARYGNVQPDVFGTLDIAEALDLADRVTKLWGEDEERHAKLVTNQTEQLAKVLSSRVFA